MTETFKYYFLHFLHNMSDSGSKESKNKLLKDIKTVTITSKGQIAIPKEVREIKGFNEGEKIAILTFDDRVELRPLKQITRKLI